MPNILFGNILQTLTIKNILLCMVVSLILGFCIAAVYMFRNTYSKNFVATLVLLPVMVQSVIFLVNGNLGTGVAVMGAFSLIRFRSVPGSAKEIGVIFFAMAVGLATGMGYLGYAVLFTVIISGFMLLLAAIPFGEQKCSLKDLKVTIPENLDYSGIFDDLFSQYTTDSKLLRVRTTNMGSMYELEYHLTLKNDMKEKEFLDAIRCRNGNLTVICGRTTCSHDEL